MTRINPFREPPCLNCESEPARNTVWQGVQSNLFCSPECQAEYEGTSE